MFMTGACLASLTWFSTLGFGARLVAPLFARPSVWRALDIVVGLMMLTIAVGLVSHAAAP